MLKIFHKIDFLDSLLQLDGRVKTLHPNIHGGILARRDQKHHMEALNKHGIGKFRCEILYHVFTFLAISFFFFLLFCMMLHCVIFC